MKSNDIDLDISKLISSLSGEDNAMYFRCRGDETKDFCHVQGDLDDLAWALGNAMKQNEQLASFIQGANAYYLE